MRYSIEGSPLPVAICKLEDGETMVSERGSMSWMTPNIKMNTNIGGMKKMFSRMFSGESIFKNTYTSQGEGEIAFASSFPGDIVAMEITPEKPIICQKSAFLAATENVDLSVFFQKRFGSGLFGGEGFVMQKLSGKGTAFVEFDGSITEYNLNAGESIIVDTGYLAAMEGSCDIEIKTVSGFKNALFGGEGLFNTVVTGPGRVWLQSMPVCQMAGVLKSFIIPENKK